MKLSAFLLFIVALSIPNLWADTNATSTPSFKEQFTTQLLSIDELNQVKMVGEYVDIGMNLIMDLNSSKLPFIKQKIKPIQELVNQIQSFSETTTTQQLDNAFSQVLQSMLFLNQLVSSDYTFEDDLQFVPDGEIPDTINRTALQAEITNQLDIFFGHMSESMHDIWANILMHLRKQLFTLDMVLHKINNNVANNKNIATKSEIKKEIMALRNTLKQIQKEMVVASANPDMVKVIYQINKAVISYLQDAQKHKFRKWSMVDLADFLSRSPSTQELSSAQLLLDIEASNHDLALLEEAAEKIDLTLVNRTARFVGDYVVDPFYRYNVLTYSTAALATIGLATYAAYYFDNTFFKSPQSWFRKIFGYRNHMTGKSNNVLDQEAGKLLGTIFSEERLTKALEASPNLALDPATSLDDQLVYARVNEILTNYQNQLNRATVKPYIPLSTMDDFIQEHRTGVAAIGATALALATSSYMQIWKDRGSEWTRKLSVWFNRLKGGNYAKLTDRFDPIISTITFDDVIGLEYEKSLIIPHLKYIKDPERWDSENRTLPHIIATGPTRSGKTFFAKAICGELYRQNPDKSFKFLAIDVHDIKAMGINNLLMFAKLHAPCVLFIDEIDLLDLQRTKNTELLSDFLQALSGINDKDPHKQVIVIATTNMPEHIDHALLQSGRFALQIRFKYPNLNERKQFIFHYLNKFAIDPQTFDINIDLLAAQTDQRSFEDIKLMLDTAFIHVSLKGQLISQEQIEWALDNQLRKIIDIDSKEVSASEKQVLAAHYAGQVLAHTLLNLEEKIAKVTIRQVVSKIKEENVYQSFVDPNHKKQTGLEQGALFTYLEHDTLDIKSQQELANKAKTLLAGRIAERIITNSYSLFFGWKKNMAFNMVKSIVADGIELSSLSKSAQNKITDQAYQQVALYEQEMEQLLMTHKDQLIMLANALEKEQTLTATQIEALLKSSALPTPAIEPVLIEMPITEETAPVA